MYCISYYYGFIFISYNTVQHGICNAFLFTGIHIKSLNSIAITDLSLSATIFGAMDLLENFLLLDMKGKFSHFLY